MSDPDLVVTEYLDRLDAALTAVPDARRRQLVAEIADHIAEPRASLPAESEVAVRDLLDQVGRPEDIAAEATEDLATPGPPAAGPERVRAASRHANWRVLVTVAGAVVLIGLGAALSVVVTQHSSRTRPTATTVTSVVTPNVVGLSEVTAAGELGAAGLTEVVTTGPTGPGVPPGTVVAQSPPARSSEATGSSVTLHVVG